MGKNKQLRKEQNRKIQCESTLSTLADYQRKLDVVVDQIGKISSKIAALHKANRISRISLSFLDNQDDDGVFYSQLGRCFIQTPSESIKEDLLETRSQSETCLPKLVKTLEQFENLRKEQINAIQELTESIKHSTS